MPRGGPIAQAGTNLGRPPRSSKRSGAWAEPSLTEAAADQRFQFERHGYFVTDRIDHSSATPVFNRITGLKDSWSK